MLIWYECTSIHIDSFEGVLGHDHETIDRRPQIFVDRPEQIGGTKDEQ